MAWTLGIITSLISTAIFVVSQMKFNYMLQAFSVLFVVPAGALLGGLIAGSGVAIALYSESKRPEKSHLALSAFLGFLTILAVYFTVYSVSYVDDKMILNYEFRGTPVSKLVLKDGKPYDFFTYVYDDITTRKYEISEHSTKVTTIDNKYYNWLQLLLEIAGFMGGALILPAALYSIKYCNKCNRYYKSVKIMGFPEKKYEEKAALINIALETPGAFDAFLKDKKKSETALSARYEVYLSYCNTCSDGVLQIRHLAGDGNEAKAQRQEIILKPEYVKQAKAAGVIKG